MKRSPHQSGIAAVEFALLLPILLLLLLGVIDGARALQANIIMVNIGREGANLAARGSIPLDTGSQDILYALMASAPPLNVERQGMVYITRVMGVVSGGSKYSVVLDQYRWDDAKRQLGYRSSGYLPDSSVYQCTSWSGTGACSGIDEKKRPRTTVMSGKLGDGEVVHVVETFYQYDMLAANASTYLGLPLFGPDLYSMTVF